MDKMKKDRGKAYLREYRKVLAARFLKNRLAVIGMAAVLLLVLAALFIPMLIQMDPYLTNPSDRLLEPSAEHWFGTDHLGRDLFARCVYGLRISLSVGLATALLSMVIGMLLGLLAGYYKSLDNVIMRICESMISIPAMLIAFALMAALGATAKNVVLSMSVVFIPLIAKVCRASVLVEKEQTYVEAARSQGAGNMNILFRYIAPNTVSPVIIQTAFVFAQAIIVESSLSFLGVGIPAPTPSLGSILNDARSHIMIAWWPTVIPGILVGILVLSINVLGDGIRDILDPTNN